MLSSLILTPLLGHIHEFATHFWSNFRWKKEPPWNFRGIKRQKRTHLLSQTACMITQSQSSSYFWIKFTFVDWQLNSWPFYHGLSVLHTSTWSSQYHRHATWPNNVIMTKKYTYSSYCQGAFDVLNLTLKMACSLIIGFVIWLYNIL